MPKKKTQLTAADVTQIRKLLNTTCPCCDLRATQEQIARKFFTTRSNVAKINAGYTWLQLQD